MDELLVALMPPRRRVSFLLGGVVSSMLRGDSETECLLEDCRCFRPATYYGEYPE
jgi:hypothetical protein